jgi:hypothetical protein
MVFWGELLHADLPVYYASGTAFCLASRIEPFDFDLFEVSAFRPSIIATAVGGIR